MSLSVNNKNSKNDKNSNKIKKNSNIKIIVNGDCSRRVSEKPPYDHVQEEHFGTNPTVKLEILAQFHGNAAMRQAAEAVTIRDEKPPLNGKEENTNQPRKRRDRNRTAVSDVN